MYFIELIESLNSYEFINKNDNASYFFNDMSSNDDIKAIYKKILEV